MARKKKIVAKKAIKKTTGPGMHSSAHQAHDTTDMVAQLSMPLKTPSSTFPWKSVWTSIVTP